MRPISLYTLCVSGPVVSAIVLNFRSPQQTVKCVQELMKQTIADRMEILVVDNHSDDDSIGIFRNRLGKFPAVRILETPDNRGFGEGYDAGIRQARGRFVLINNPDKLLERGALECMVRKMKDDPSIGILAPKLLHADGTVRLSARAFPQLLDVIAKRTILGKIFPHRVRHYLQLDLPLDETRDVEWIAGGCFLTPLQLLRELNGFDPRFFLFFEDIDLCRRVWERGKRVVFFPEARGLDRKRRLSEIHALLMPFKRMGRIHMKSAVKYFWKWRGKPLPR